MAVKRARGGDEVTQVLVLSGGAEYKRDGWGARRCERRLGGILFGTLGILGEPLEPVEGGLTG